MKVIDETRSIPEILENVNSGYLPWNGDWDSRYKYLSNIKRTDPAQLSKEDRKECELLCFSFTNHLLSL